MKSIYTKRLWLCLMPFLLYGMLTCADALTFDIKPVKLSADQRASLKRFLTDSSPALSFDWNSLEAHSHSTGQERQPLSVSISTVPALTAAGVCRSEQHHFHVKAGIKSGNGRWHANDDLTHLQAWTPQGAECAVPSSPIGVDKSLTDAEFLLIERGKDALRARAAQVIGGSDCARVRYCEVTLRRINRVSQESRSRISRIVTTLTFSPLKPGPACLYVMEVSFVGPINNMVPLGASCPMPRSPTDFSNGGGD